VTPEQRELLDHLIDTLKAGGSLTISETHQLVNYLLVLKNLTYRLHGEWDKVK